MLTKKVPFFDESFCHREIYAIPKSTFTIITLVFFVFQTALTQDVNLSLGLQAHYAFNANADDLSGNGHHGTTFGTPLVTTDRFDNANAAYEFDGIDDYINTFSTFDSEDRTLSLWINPYDIIGAGGLPENRLKRVAISMDAVQLNYGILRVDIDNGELKLWAGGQTGTYTTDTIAIDTWYHLVLIREGSTTKYYINGAFVGEGTSDSYGSDVDANPQLIIGAGRTATYQFFKGKIDDIRIYNRAVNEDEVSALYHEGEMTSDAIEAPVVLDEILIFPNPFADLVTFSKTVSGDMRVDIFNSKGQLVISQHISENNASINLSGLERGIYFVKAYAQGKVFSQKIVKQSSKDRA